MVRPGSTIIVPPPLMRRVTRKPSSEAASRSTSLPTTWFDPSTSARSCHSQRRRVGPRCPAARRSSRTSSSAIWASAGRGSGLTTSQRRSPKLLTDAGLLEHLCGVAVGLHVVPGPLDASVLAHQERGADDPDRRLPVQHLLPVGAVPRGHLVAGIAQQVEAQPVLAAKAA